MLWVLAISLGSSLQARALSFFQGIGDLPGGTFYSEALGLSGDGRVVVGESHSAAGYQAFRWTQATGILPIDSPSGFFQYPTQAFAASRDGSTIVGAAPINAFRWTAGTGMVSLGSGPLATGGFLQTSAATAVSADGSVIAGRGEGPNGVDMPFRWTAATGVVGLGNLGGLQCSCGGAADISPDGSVIVGYSSSDRGERAFRWTQDSGMSDLGLLRATDLASWAAGVSADGRVVAGSTLGSPGEAFWWTAQAGIVGLGFPGGMPNSAANDVSADGSRILGYAYSSSEVVPYLWTTGGAAQRLDEVFDDYGLDLDGWTLLNAIHISDDGNVFLGIGINPNGQRESWIAAIPEPSSLSLGALGAITLLVARRR